MSGKRMITRGRMARRLVYFCIVVLTIAAVWAATITTVAVICDTTVDLSAT